MRANVRLLHSDLPAYFVMKHARMNAIEGYKTREQYFWEMAGQAVFLFLLVSCLLILVFA